MYIHARPAASLQLLWCPFVLAACASHAVAARLSERYVSVDIGPAECDAKAFGAVGGAHRLSLRCTAAVLVPRSAHGDRRAASRLHSGVRQVLLDLLL